MNRNTADLEDVHYFLDVSDQATTWIRAVVDLQTGSAVLAYVELFVGPEPKVWRGDEVWTYDECVFVACGRPTDQMAKVFDPDRASSAALSLGSDVPELHLQDIPFSVQHEPSLPQHDRNQCPWPTLRFTMGLQGLPNLQLPSGFLIGSGAPSFPVAAGAFNAFFFDDFRVTGANQPSLGQLVIRIADVRGRYSRVRVRPSSLLDLQVDGTDPESLVVELNSATYRVEVKVPKTGSLQLPLPDGLPDDTWIWLKSGREWVDFRSLSGWPAYQNPSVEIESPDDTEADLSGLIAQGEGQFLEFKSKIPRSKTEKYNTFKTMTAFAMEKGGTLIFGVEDRSGALIGLDLASDEAMKQLTDLIRALVVPTPDFTLTGQSLDGKSLIVAEIRASEGTPHALIIDGNKPEYFVRRGATTFRARPEELSAVMAARTANHFSAGSGFFQ